MLSYAIKHSAKLMLWFRERCVFLIQQFLQRDIIQCVLSLVFISVLLYPCP